MAISKKLTVFCLGMLLCMSLVVRVSSSAAIGNGAMKGDDGSGCGPENRQGCKEGQGNPYSRGCEKGQDCRGP
ncbi:conserved hypothetical protein [Ricinus communis]|uniref:RALFL33 n=1 Tax=Ricinus communis TaxID=3988 RepID=B9SBV0_RICCO|nr:conserved hypothetical protein [Ricinus communis]